MYLISYFLLAVAEVLDVLLTVFMWTVVARAVLSWVNPDPLNPLVRLIRNITEPAIRLVRSKMPIFYDGMDFSPIIVFLFIIFLRIFVISSLTQAARSLM